MRIKLLKIESSFYSTNEKKIKDFGVKFDYSENFTASNTLNTTNITIDYDISLFKNNNINFGKISARYEIEIPESIEFLTLNETIKNDVLLYCFKQNHNNINNLIKSTLKENGFILIEKRKQLYH